MNSRRLGAIVIVILSISLFVVVRSTYARYTTTASNSKDIKVSKWLIKVNSSNVTTSDHSFDIGEIKWDNTGIKATSGTIAPGMSGVFYIVIDASDTNVVCDYEVVIDKDKLPDFISLDTDNEYTGTLKLHEVKKIAFKIKWEDSDNDTDIASQNKEFKIPVTVNVKQHID